MDTAVQLNPQQRRAVESIAGPLLVIAGAGAGKTKVIVERIRNIMRQGVPGEQVLAITFTNKAAAEMRSRLQESNRFTGTGPFISTFHSLGLFLIKENASLLGFKRTPAIYDRSDSLREIKAALKAADVEDIEPRMVLSAISKHKGEGTTAGEFSASASTWREKIIAAAWLRYEKALREEGAVDFDDLLGQAVALLEKNMAVRERCQTRWKYIHVDEYQDTNGIQARMAELLVGPEKNICVVGDIDQTIYGWRGAQIENMLQFEKKYGGEVVMLEENYRSTKAILSAANSLIQNNTNRPEKNLFTKNADGDPISVYIAGDGGDEAYFVARTIKRLMEDGCRPQDCAVLYRANFQSRAIEEKLLMADLPYQVLGTRFFDRKEVKDVLSWLRAGLTPTSADMGRVIDSLPGIGKVSKLKILSGKADELPARMREKVAAMHRLLASIAEDAQHMPPSALLRDIIKKSGIEQALKEDKAEGAERLENLAELVSVAARYDQLPMPQGIEQFMESAALAGEADELKETKDQVRLMTVHAAKGLEFPYVFIVGLEEGLFPYERDDSERDTLEEERRLMYVAITRARKKLYLSYAMMRTMFGNTEMRSHSQFLNELPGDLLQAESPERLGKTIYLD